MKHIIYLFCFLLITASCATTKYVTFGDVTVLNSAGEVIKQFDDSILDAEEYIKYPQSQCLVNGGLKFTDANGESHYVSGGIILVDNIETIVYSDQPSKEEMKEELSDLKEELSVKKKYFKEYKRILSPEETIKVKSEIKDIKKQIFKLENALYDPDEIDYD